MKHLQRNAGILAATLILLAGSLGVSLAQGKVDFSGKWKIDEAKSKLNEQYSSHPTTVTVTQAGNEMTVVRVSDMRGQEMTFTDKYTLDGKECKNKGFRDSEVISTANWSPDGKSLKINSKVSTDNGDMTMERTLRMEGDNLVMDFTVNGSFGESSETWVFDRQ